MCNHYSQEMFLCPTVQWLVRIPILSVPPHSQEIKRGTQRFAQHLQLQECQVAGTCQGKSILCRSGTEREVMEPSSPALPRRRRRCGRGSRSAARWVCQQSPSGAGPDTTGQGSGGDGGCSQEPHRCLPCRTGQTRSLCHTSSTAGSCGGRWRFYRHMTQAGGDGADERLRHRESHLQEKAWQRLETAQRETASAARDGRTLYHDRVSGRTLLSRGGNPRQGEFPRASDSERVSISVFQQPLPSQHAVPGSSSIPSLSQMPTLPLAPGSASLTPATRILPSACAPGIHTPLELIKTDAIWGTQAL